MIIHLDDAIKDIIPAVCRMVQRYQEPSCHRALRWYLCLHRFIQLSALEKPTHFRAEISIQSDETRDTCSCNTFWCFVRLKAVREDA
jgi:hypothetical protein